MSRMPFLLFFILLIIIIQVQSQNNKIDDSQHERIGDNNILVERTLQGDGEQIITSFTVPTCDTDRPNSSATHRTLEIPSSMLPPLLSSMADEDDNNNNNNNSTTNVAQQATLIEEYATSLCCVYTYIVVVDDKDSLTTTNAILETYDGNRRTIRGETFADVAQNALNDICGMTMGSLDCRAQQECMYHSPTTTTTTTSGSEGSSLSAPSGIVANLFLSSWITMLILVAV